MESRGQYLPGEKELLRIYNETLDKDPDHFKHYWEETVTQVVAFGLGWEVAGPSEDYIWNFMLTLDRQQQSFCWVHPPEPDEEDFFNSCCCDALHA